MAETKPNVIYIYADDLGRGMLGCYGQQLLETPNIDRLRRGGMMFNRMYGCHICAPARASLICGVHDCHNGRWTFTRAGLYKDYARGTLPLSKVFELINNTGIEQKAGDVFLPMVFKQAGYCTGQIGKLEWGFATTGDEIKKHGWDYHYGYYDHEMCHGFFPPFLFENGVPDVFPQNREVDCGASRFEKHMKDPSVPLMEEGEVYSQDMFDEKICAYIEKHRDGPFFLFHPSQLPHGLLSIPQIDPRVEHRGDFTKMEKVYASMVLRLDNTVGLIMDTLEKFNLTEKTMVIFAADNGHECYYQSERTGFPDNFNIRGEAVDHLNVRYTSEDYGDIFDGNDGLTGKKTTNFEGGTRIPFIVRWPGVVAENSICDRMAANYDFLSTIADMLGADEGFGKDGISYLPLLTGNENNFAGHDYVVYAGGRGPALITKDGWKIRTHFKNLQFPYWFIVPDQIVFELYNTADDPREENNLAEKFPQKLEELRLLLFKECDGSLFNGMMQPHFAFYSSDYA
ncbi:MAG: sulfatase-like hydrolase/transferase [Defluviitaleaceae bacterium]|nr:sulfatase-like hydrolase/transferase [Defluviitaleaceae bacterium]